MLISLELYWKSCMSIMAAVHAVAPCGHTLCGELIDLPHVFIKTPS